ncbi:MAG: 23S rRNA (adenine(2503)-C(2))-methyltransferase RlmN [Proteobacteria bacterium]|nr:23S rRNA (adenine(2503)-C(2))-methyltransferase RlmN [Pseudomonadota bacterium]
MKSLLSHTTDELREAFGSAGLPAYRAGLARGERYFARMTDLPERLRGELAELWSTRSLSTRAVHTAADGTRKLELSTADGGVLEAVLIPERGRRTLCVSSQIGCSLDCAFCATGRLGLGRNLDAAEIVDQVLVACDLLRAAGESVTHVVYMGMGEPLLNWPQVMRSIRVLVDPDGPALSPRRITVSTAGVVSRLPKLAEAPPVGLAVSLHATTDEVRDELVPLNRRFPIARLLEACAELDRLRSGRLTFEYTLIRDVNDSDEDARRLARLIRPLRAGINLIAMNEHPGADYRRPDEARLNRFALLASSAGARVTVRRSRGDDIYAACGQLARLTPAPAVAPLSGAGAG